MSIAMPPAIVLAIALRNVMTSSLAATAGTLMHRWLDVDIMGR